MIDVSELKSAELRDELRAAGQPSSYTRAELIHRVTRLRSTDAPEPKPLTSMSDANKAKISNALRGRVMSDEHKAKIAAARQANLEAKYMVFYGDSLNHPMTVGLYGSKRAAEEAIELDGSSAWTADQDFCMLYEGKPGENLKFIRHTMKGALSGADDERV